MLNGKEPSEDVKKNVASWWKKNDLLALVSKVA
jgi:hypothetical protein